MIQPFFFTTLYFLDINRCINHSVKNNIGNINLDWNRFMTLYCIAISPVVKNIKSIIWMLYVNDITNKPASIPLMNHLQLMFKSFFFRFFNIFIKPLDITIKTYHLFFISISSVIWCYIFFATFFTFHCSYPHIGHIAISLFLLNTNQKIFI